jgi:hypothetical protein
MQVPQRRPIFYHRESGQRRRPRGGREPERRDRVRQRRRDPTEGGWRTVFNSDFYDHFASPRVVESGIGISARGSALYEFGLPAGLPFPAYRVTILTEA